MYNPGRKTEHNNFPLGTTGISYDMSPSAS